MARETKALLKVAEDVQGNFAPDAIFEHITNSEICTELNLTQKYSKVQLVNKVKKLAKAKK